MKGSKYPLVPLRIPSGWVMEKNAFYDLAPSEKMERDAFSADILFIRLTVRPPRQGWYIIGLD